MFMLRPGSSLAMIYASFLLFLISKAADTGQPGPSKGKGRPASGSPPDQTPSKRPVTYPQDYTNALEWSNIFLAIYPGAPAKKQTAQDLERWGWKRVEGTQLPLIDVSYLRSPLLALGAGDPSQHHSRVCFAHQPPETGRLSSTSVCLDQYLFHDAGVIAVTEVNEPSDDVAIQGNSGGDKLDEWQDVMAVAWESLCQLHHAGTPACDRLTWILMSKINDKELLDIMETALGGDWRTLKIWPGNSFPTSTDAGKALLGSPLGRRAAKLIAQHQDMFPNKIVAEVVVYDPLGSINEGEIREDWLHSKFPGLAFRIKATTGQSSQVWQQAVAKGREIVASLDTRAIFQPQSTFNSFDSVARYGWQRKQRGLPAFNADAVKDAYHHFRLDTKIKDPGHQTKNLRTANHMASFCHSGVARQSYTQPGAKFAVDRIEYRATMATINQAATPALGVLVIQDVITTQQAATSLPISSTPDNHPPVGEWHDLGFLLWKGACEADAVQPEILTLVFAIGIEDQETDELARGAYVQATQDPNFTFEWPGTPGFSTGAIAFSVQTEQGMALLASSMGQQVAGMLRSHRASFPTSYIDKVYLYFVIMDWTNSPRSGKVKYTGPVQTRPCLIFHILHAQV